MIDLYPPDPVPSNGVTAERAYWKVGTGLPDSDGQVGYDLTWLDANGAIVSQRLTDTSPRVTITEAEYDVLIAAWKQPED